MNTQSRVKMQPKLHGRKRKLYHDFFIDYTSTASLVSEVELSYYYENKNQGRTKRMIQAIMAIYSKENYTAYGLTPTLLYANSNRGGSKPDTGKKKNKSLERRSAAWRGGINCSLHSTDRRGGGSTVSLWQRNATPRSRVLVVGRRLLERVGVMH